MYKRLKLKIHIYKKYLVLVLLVFLIKLVALTYFSFLSRCHYGNLNVAGVFASDGGDTFSYLGPVDNFIKEGRYYFFNGKKEIYAGRMPYYGVIYYLLRLLFSRPIACDILVLVQLILESISIIYLAILAKKILKTDFSFWLTLIIATCSFFISQTAFILMPESLAASTIVLFIYYYWHYGQTRRAKYFFLAGIWLSFLVLLRPHFIALYFFVFLDLITNHFSFRGMAIWSGLKKSIYLFSILIFFLLPWTIRNYSLLGKFIPLQESTTAGYDFDEAHFAYRRFVQAWGGSLIYWDKRSAGCYFIVSDNPCEFHFPPYAFTEGYTLKDIEHVRDKYVALQKKYSDSLSVEVINDFDRLTGIYIKEQPIRYYFTSRIMLLKDFLFHSGSYYLPINSSFKCYHSYQLLIKIVESLLYYLTLLAGISGLIILFIKNRSTAILLAIPVYLIILFPFFLRMTYFGYFMQSHPMLILGTVFLANTFVAKYILRRSSD
jgi:hypothetical protein